MSQRVPVHAMAEQMVTHPVDCEDGWIPCGQCLGDGSFHDCGEDSCCCADPEIQDRWTCAECRGAGGWPCPVCKRQGLD